VLAQLTSWSWSGVAVGYVVAAITTTQMISPNFTKLNSAKHNAEASLRYVDVTPL
jgi:ABC-type uncharacterized transport system fused permease/ATPase subunit